MEIQKIKMLKEEEKKNSKPKIVINGEKPSNQHKPRIGDQEKLGLP